MKREPVKRRPYESPAREAAARENRRRIRAVAGRLFVEKGFGATTMAGIAAAAEVSERTVYLVFPTKATLFNECIRVAIRGDDDEPEMLARASWQAALNAPPERMLALVADAGTRLMRRAARLLAVGESVGLDDPLIEEFRERGRAAARSDGLAVAEALEQAQLLREGMSVEQAADIIYAIASSESVYLRLVQQRGWTDGEYARLIERTLAGVLTDR
jgi:AcrR family transcriptional regulator